MLKQGNELPESNPPTLTYINFSLKAMASGAIMRKTSAAAFDSNEPSRSQLMQVKMSGGRLRQTVLRRGRQDRSTVSRGIALWI